MVTYSCRDSNGDRLDFLYQWDTNRYISITGIQTQHTGGISFNFCNKLMQSAYVVTPESEENYYYSNIPNELLKTPDVIRLFIVETNSDSGERRTLTEIAIPVIPRVMPTEYIYQDVGDEEIADGLLAVGRILSLTSNGNPVGEQILLE